MSATPRPEGPWRFALRALAWLVPCFALWYFAAPAYARPAAWLASIFANAFTDDSIAKLEWHGRIATFVTRVTVPAEGGRRAVLLPEADPLVYTYGAALFAALALASRLGVASLLLGLVALLPFQAWGIAFDVLAQIGVKAGPEAAAQASLLGIRRELVPLGYQFGSLIFPALMPVLAWAWLGGLRPFVRPPNPASQGADNLV